MMKKCGFYLPVHSGRINPCLHCLQDLRTEASWVFTIFCDFENGENNYFSSFLSDPEMPGLSGNCRTKVLTHQGWKLIQSKTN